MSQGRCASTKRFWAHPTISFCRQSGVIAPRQFGLSDRVEFAQSDRAQLDFWVVEDIEHSGTAAMITGGVLTLVGAGMYAWGSSSPDTPSKGKAGNEF